MVAEVTAVRKILLIAPACDGQDVGESWLAHQWAAHLSARADLTVLTTYKQGHVPASQQLPGVRVIEWGEPPLIGRLERLNSLMQPNYVPFYVRARRWIRARLAEGEHFDVAHQVVPVAMRYPCPAAGLGVPLVMGPVGGSLASPPAFVAEEGATPWYQRLRAVDRAPPASRPPAPQVLRVGRLRGRHRAVRPRPPRRSATQAVRGDERDCGEHHPPTSRPVRPVGPVRLLHVGRVVRTKGLRDVIRAMAQLGDLDVVLDVLGEGNDRPACEDLVRELGLQGRVRFHGAVPRDVVDGFYARADVFVFPSYREPGGNVALEAMSYGLPLVVCERGGPGANVDESCAFRLAADSPEQLAWDCRSRAPARQ